MSEYRPLSRRDDPGYDEPVEGVPGYLLATIQAWVEPHVFAYPRATMSGPYPRKERLTYIETRLRLSPPLDWGGAGRVHSAWSSLIMRFESEPDVALDCLDLLLRDTSDARAASLESALAAGGSAWRVVNGPDSKYRLERRYPPAVADAIDATRSDSERAHSHLRRAWGALAGRHPDPSTAYREAVRAVEVAAKPIVAPANGRATLGTMIGDMASKPEKWRVKLDNATVQQIVEMCRLIWKGQTDRHGSDAPDAPLNVSQEEADTAFYGALALTRWFTSGAITRRDA